MFKLEVAVMNASRILERNEIKKVSIKRNVEIFERFQKHANLQNQG